MTVRTLTIEEMMTQETGDTAVLLGHWEAIPVGTVLTRKRVTLDDTDSVAYEYGADWNFFEEGEVGVVESGVGSGRIATDFSKHMELFTTPLVEPGSTVETGCSDTLGVFRPELETRKAGKIRVELVDDGFPLALREVAHVMTWAQTAKGYKDHDWQNLPNAEIALAAAASRHRTDHIKQRVVDGLDIDQCVDIESGLLHKAHEAFGVLSQLELMLRGKFVDSRPQVGV
jgi:hypothetical protein